MLVAWVMFQGARDTIRPARRDQLSELLLELLAVNARITSMSSNGMRSSVSRANRRPSASAPCNSPSR